MPASIKHLTDKRLNLTSLLARWTDGLYYTAAIVRCDKTNKKCLVCFEDGSEVWVKNRDIHIQLSLEQLNEDEDIVCCICDDGFSEPPNEIILCDVCQQGYHQKCHTPPVDSSSLDETDDTSAHKDWFCATCSYILNQSNRAKLGANPQPQQPQSQQQQQQQHQKQSQQSLPKQDPPQIQPPKPKLHQSPQPPKPQPPKPQQSPQSKPNQSPQPKPQPSPSPQPKPQPQQIPQSPKSQPEQSKSIAQHQPHQPHQPQRPQSQSQQQVSPQQKPQAKPRPQSTSPQVLPQQASPTGPIKSPANNVQKPAPYYPLSNQARVVATSSTAALASMTASSALVVGGSAGRTKQDLVNQSNKSSQRQRPLPSNDEVASLPVKHAVRKSSVNFTIPVRQSALPTATRSVLPNTPPTPPKVPNLIATTAATQPSVVTTINPIPKNSISSNNSNNANNNSGTRDKRPPQSPVISQAPPTKKAATWTMTTQGLVNTSSATQIIKPNERPNDPTPATPNFNVNTNNSCKQTTLADSKVSVTSTTASSSSSHPSREASGSSIIVTAKSAQPTVIVSAETKQTGQKLS